MRIRSVFGLIAMLLTAGLETSANAAEEAARDPAQAAIDQLFDDFRSGKWDTNEFPKLGFDAIPALLERADSDKRLKKFPRNPASSQFEPECSEGMVALWLIEGIRKGKSFPSLNSLCMRPADGQTEDWTQASELNHKDVAKLYRTWWEKVRQLPHKEARKLDPLKDSDLSWH
jgi:hypothetical protein